MARLLNFLNYTVILFIFSSKFFSSFPLQNNQAKYREKFLLNVATLKHKEKYPNHEWMTMTNGVENQLIVKYHKRITTRQWWQYSSWNFAYYVTGLRVFAAQISWLLIFTNMVSCFVFTSFFKIAGFGDFYRPLNFKVR